jgi:benzoate transport
MSSTAKVDVQQLIDSGRFTRYQFLIAFLCFIIIAIDGFDTAIIGFIAPSLRGEWHLSPQQLAPLLSAGLVGLAFGSFLAGPLGDRIGRKTILVVSVLFFGIWSLASAYTDSLLTLTIFRFLTGLGLGGAMPNAITLTSEYAPQRSKSTVVTLMFCGFTLGSGLGGVLAAHMIPEYGWRSVLLFGGYVPIACAVVFYFLLPESVRFLVLRRPGSKQIETTLRRVAPDAQLAGASFFIPEPPAAVRRSPVAQLFASPLAFGTLALWAAFFMSLLIVYLLTNWLPTLFKDAGFPIAKAALVSAMYRRRDRHRPPDGSLQSLPRARPVLPVRHRLHRPDRIPVHRSAAPEPGRGRRGLLHQRLADRGERPGRRVLPDQQPRHRRQLGAGRRPLRRDPRLADGWCAARRRPGLLDHHSAARHPGTAGIRLDLRDVRPISARRFR